MSNVGLEQGRGEKSVITALAHEEITTKTLQREGRRRPYLQNETSPRRVHVDLPADESGELE